MSNAYRACLLCRYFEPVPPKDWKQGMSEEWREENFDIHTAGRIIKATGDHIEGDCAFNPAHVRVWTSHSCGQFQAIYSPRPFMSLHDFIYGSESDRYREENMRLRRQLKAARERSAKRMLRIQWLEGKAKQAQVGANGEAKDDESKEA